MQEQQGIKTEHEINPKTLKTIYKQAFNEAAFERKKDSYQQFKIITSSRLKTINFHRDLLEAIQFRLERKAKISQDCVQGIRHYFLNKIEQEKQNAKSINENAEITTFYKDKDLKYDLYPGVIRAFSATYEIDKKISENIQVLANFIQVSILGGIFESEIQKYDQQVKNFRDQYYKSRKDIVECLESQAKKVQKYQKHYQQIEQGKQVQVKDFYHLEQKYLSTLQQTLEAQQKSAEFSIKFWHELLTLEYQRLDAIQKAFQLYIKQYQITYGTQGIFDPVIQVFNEINPKIEAQNNLSIKHMITEQEILMIKDNLKLSREINFQDVCTILRNVKIEPQYFECKHPLILKQYSIKRDHGTLTKDYQSAELVLTVDHNILIFDNLQENISKKAEWKLDCQNIRLEQKEGLYFTLESVKNGLIFNSKEKVSIQFEDLDQFEELKCLIENIGLSR